MDLLTARYKRISHLGSGGNGTVWCAQDTRSNSLVAVKMIPTTKITQWVYDSKYGRIPLEVAILKLLADKKFHCIELLNYYNEGYKSKFILNSLYCTGISNGDDECCCGGFI